MDHGETARTTSDDTYGDHCVIVRHEKLGAVDLELRHGPSLAAMGFGSRQVQPDGLMIITESPNDQLQALGYVTNRPPRTIRQKIRAFLQRHFGPYPREYW